MKILFLICLLAGVFPSYADDTGTAKIPGVDFTKPGPAPSPSPKPPSGTGKRNRHSSAGSTSLPVGVGAAGNNDGYTAGQGKVKIGF